MTKAALPHQILWEARELAKAHNMYVVEVHDTINPRPGYRVQVTAYVLYRQAINGSPTQRIGKRRDPRELLNLVKHAAGVAA